MSTTVVSSQRAVVAGGGARAAAKLLGGGALISRARSPTQCLTARATGSTDDSLLEPIRSAPLRISVAKVTCVLRPVKAVATAGEQVRFRMNLNILNLGYVSPIACSNFDAYMTHKESSLRIAGIWTLEGDSVMLCSFEPTLSGSWRVSVESNRQGVAVACACDAIDINPDRIDQELTFISLRDSKGSTYSLPGKKMEFKCECNSVLKLHVNATDKYSNGITLSADDVCVSISGAVEKQQRRTVDSEFEAPCIPGKYFIFVKVRAALFRCILFVVARPHVCIKFGSSVACGEDIAIPCSRKFDVVCTNDDGGNACTLTLWRVGGNITSEYRDVQPEIRMVVCFFCVPDYTLSAQSTV